MTADSCPHCYAPFRANGRPSCACAARATTAGPAIGPVTGDTSAQTTDDQTTDARAAAPRADDQPRAVRPYLRLSGERGSGPRPRDVGKFFRKSKGETEPAAGETAATEAAAAPRHGRESGQRTGPPPGLRTGRVPGGEGNAADETQAIDRIAPITPADRITPGGPVDRTRVIDRITAAGRRDSAARTAAGGATGPVTGAVTGAAHGEGHGGGSDSETVSSSDGGGGRRRKNRRKPVATAVAGAAAVVVAGTLAFTTGLLGGNKDGGGKRGDSALGDTQTSVPDEPPTEDEGATPSRRSTPSKKPSASQSPAKPPSASRNQDRATPPAPRTPSAPPTTRPTTPPAPDRPSTPDKPRQPTKPPTTEPPKTPEPTGPPVLREGDSGAEVTELQKRLTQLLLFIGTADGEYDDVVKNAVVAYQERYDIKGDPEGVYGENTRRDLEARTDEP
ncbi:peptidoglycan-binding domain-containing protein [Streptomyces sp. BRA346]|uniref:peptidoglycan-binding domain-containing protein n=1 Tax=Streptomyces sp. BRA346 TaxID=2878199 RepID=UPI0040637743